MRKRTISLHSISSAISTSTRADAMRRLANASFVLVDRALADTCAPYICAVPHCVTPAGEISKSRAVFDSVLDALFDARIPRSGTVAVIGGGALCDVGAFAASIYMRGITVELFPTTLLAMVDAAIGGKTAINYGPLKNMVGSFYPAAQVVIAPEFLSTLGYNHICCGLAEIIKAGMLRDESILTDIETHARDLKQQWEQHIYGTPMPPETREWWDDLIWKAAGVKMDIVENDFHERGERTFLNLGHTFAHAVEAEAKRAGTPWTHGAAVALGIRSALALGVQLHITDTAYSRRMNDVLDMFEYPDNYGAGQFSVSALIAHMKRDKKNTTDAVRFVLQKRACETVLQAVDTEHTARVLRAMGAVD